MTVTIENIANRMVALHCNSGQTVYLPVGMKLDLPAVEVADNPMFEKLKNKNLLRLIDAPPPQHQPAPVDLEQHLVAGDVPANADLATEKAKPTGKASKSK